MKALVLAAVAVIATVGGMTTAGADEARLPDFTALAKRNSPAVVNISSTMKPAKLSERMPPGYNGPDIPEDSPLGEFFRHFFGDEGPGGPGSPGAPGGGRSGQDPRSSLGSGFIISKDGYIITNYHVVREADEIVVRMSDRTEHPAKIVGSDQRSDVAVLKVTTDKDLPTVTLGDSDKLEVGEWVLAIGSPFGFDYSVTAGIVSAKGRALPNENYVPFIQTDVAINPGNSGGPLFNLKGEVVGVNSQIYSRTGGFMGVSFAIPVQVVLNVYKQLREHGSVSRGWLGVLIQDVTQELAESFAMDKPSGALVSKVLDGSPAEKSGVQTGDVILSFAGSTVERSSELPPMVGNTHVGDKIPMEIIREGKKRSITINIGALPEEEPAVAAGPLPEKSKLDPKFKIAVTDPSKQQRDQAQVGEGGALVEDIAEGPALSAGIRAGDLIIQLNNHKIGNAKQFRELAATLPAGRSVPVLIQRQGGPLFLAMKVPQK